MVSLAVLLAAAGVTVAVMLFLGIGPFKLNSSGTDQGDDPQPQTWQTETQLQPDTGESETQTVSGLVMIDIDGVTNQQCTVEGTIGAESGGNYPLQLQPLKTVYAYDEGGAKETLTNVASLYVVPGQAVASDKLSLCAGIEVQVTGGLQIRGDRVYLIPSSIVRSDGQPIEPAPPVEEQIHRYDLVVSDCTWEEAFSRAAPRPCRRSGKNMKKRPLNNKNDPPWTLGPCLAAVGAVRGRRLLHGPGGGHGGPVGGHRLPLHCMGVVREVAHLPAADGGGPGGRRCWPWARWWGGCGSPGLWWAAVTLILSLVDYFKIAINGTPLCLADFGLATQLGQVPA